MQFKPNVNIQQNQSRTITKAMVTKSLKRLEKQVKEIPPIKLKKVFLHKAIELNQMIRNRSME